MKCNLYLTFKFNSISLIEGLKNAHCQTHGIKLCVYFPIFPFFNLFLLECNWVCLPELSKFYMLNSTVLYPFKKKKNPNYLLHLALHALKYLPVFFSGTSKHRFRCICRTSYTVSLKAKGWQRDIVAVCVYICVCVYVCVCERKGKWNKWTAEAAKGPRRVCSDPSCLVHFRWPGPRAASIIQRLIELTFRRALPTPGLPVLCQPLTIPLVSHRQGRSENRPRESTQAEAGMVGWGGGGREGLQGGSWGPPFQFHSVFPNERKGREWCPLSPCHTGTFKKQPQWFLKWGVFSRDKKRGKEWVGEEFNCGPVWGTGSGRMATLAFVKDRASLLVLPLCVSLALWNLRWAQTEKLHHWSFSGNSH